MDANPLPSYTCHSSCMGLINEGIELTIPHQLSWFSRGAIIVVKRIYLGMLFLSRGKKTGVLGRRETFIDHSVFQPTYRARLESNQGYINWCHLSLYSKKDLKNLNLKSLVSVAINTPDWFRLHKFFLFCFSAFIGKVKNVLPEDAAKKHVRYLVAISKVLKNTDGTLPEGDTVVSVPYDKSPDCPCPSLPGKTFIVAGNFVTESKEENPKQGLILSQGAFVQKWNEKNKDFLAKVQTKCGEHMNFKGLI